jgi:iron(III) transport system permease protein
VAGVTLIVAYLALVPIGFLLWQTFVHGGHFTLASFRTAYSDAGLFDMTLNSFAFAMGSTTLAVVLGTGLAHLVVRTDVPFKALMFGASLVPLIIPGILHTIAWFFLLSPQIGVLNLHLIRPLTGHDFNVTSIPGMILVEGLHLTPLVFLLMVASFRSMDPSLEESAIMSGAPLRKVFFRITLPLARPALYAAILIMAVRTLESFEVPAVLGLNQHIWVFTSRIWSTLNAVPPDYSTAGAYAMSLLVLTSIGVFWHGRLTRRSRAYQTVTGKGFRPRPIPLGKWKWPATALIFAYFVVSVVLPLAILFYASMQTYYAPPTGYTLTHGTWDNYKAVFHDPLVQHGFKNSLILALASATVVMLIAAVASWIVVRTKLRGRWLIDNLAFLPLTIPGLVLGVAIHPVRDALLVDVDVPDRPRARGVGADERRRLVPGVPTNRAPAARARLRRRLDLHRDRLGTRARELGAALLARPRGPVDRDLGDVAQRPVPGALRARDPDGQRPHRPRRYRIQARRQDRRQGGLTNAC